MGLQFSNNHLQSYSTGLLRDQDQSLLSLRLSRAFGKQTSQIIFGSQTSDGSMILQLEHLLPVGDNLEVKFGADLFDGPPASQFGQLHRASRVYSTLKFFFKG